MSDVYFKASLQNTLNPEVGTFDNVGNKEGTFTLEDGEYYLTNKTSNSYRVYYPTKDIYSVGFTIEFDLNYSTNSRDFKWCLLFNGDNSYWYGFGINGSDLEYRDGLLPNCHLITSPNTWLHVKCIFNYYHNQNYVDIYIDNDKVNNFVISNDYGIKYIDILGNSVDFVPSAKIKNIIIYRNSNKHYLDTTGLTSLWSKIKSLFATKTELASKANTSDLSTVATSGDYNDLINKPNTCTVAYPDGPEAHNAMWGGRDITAAFNNGTFSTNVANGTFKDIFPGDYITKSVTISGKTYNVTWVVADCDYWINKGDQNNGDENHGMETHHVVIVPQKPIFKAYMNRTNNTEGGYADSRMYTETIPACATGIVNAFGSDHILTFRDGISNSVDTSHVSSGMPLWTGTPGWVGEWVSVQCNLMSEKMVYGAPICAAGALDNIMATRQMSAFRLSERLINYNRQDWWLRDVVSSSHFAFVGGIGIAYTNDASNVNGVRPFALLK